MKIFYHDDMDGVVSAFCVNNLRQFHDNRITEMISMDYTKKFPIKTVRKNEIVYIVDFSIKPREMDGLLEITKNVTWIDHHETAINLYQNLDAAAHIDGIRKVGYSGAMLTHVYMTNLTLGGVGKILEWDDKYAEKAPLFIRLVDDYDCWKGKMEPSTTAFKLWWDAQNIGPKDDRLLYISEGTILNTAIPYGKSIKSYIDAQNKYHLDSASYEAIFDGHKCLVCNRKANSWLFGDRINDYDFCVTSVFNGKQWTYTLYSVKEDIHVGEICKQHGGGGHKGAAGFTNIHNIFLRI